FSFTLIRHPKLSTLFPYTTLFRSDPQTIFQGIHKLPPAHYLVYRDGRAETFEYWDVDFNEDDSLTESEWVERLREQIKRSVEMRSEEHTSELQSPYDLVCRLLLEK